MNELSWITPAAACRQPGVDPEMFMAAPRFAVKAKQVCRECPLINECRAYAVSKKDDEPPLYGVWGGWLFLGGGQIDASEPWLKPFDTSMCGTVNGRRRHERLGLPACAECRRAHNEYRAARKARLKAAA